VCGLPIQKSGLQPPLDPDRHGVLLDRLVDCNHLPGTPAIIDAKPRHIEGEIGPRNLGQLPTSVLRPLISVQVRNTAPELILRLAISLQRNRKRDARGRYSLGDR
jgi:hypothetical protein